MGDFPRLTKPMHRFVYSALSKDQIGAKFDPAIATGPAHASPLSGVLAGKSLKVVTDKGLTLAYNFASNNKLSFSENGGASGNAGYGALTLHDEIALFSHLVPGSQRGFTVVIDQRSGVATVFETWFSGFTDNREVQREIYYGYVDKDGDAPKARHAATNRFEGKGFHWKQDTGFETLEYYASYAYSHFVEMGRDKKNGFCAPSDYIKIDDQFYVYARVECEFSGAMTLAVIDLDAQEQVGMRMGFDEADALHYYVFRAKGAWTGQIAQFEKFGDVAGNAMAPRPVPTPPGSPPAPPPVPAKGARAVYRPVRGMTKMTPAQVSEAVAKSSVAFAPRSPIAGANMAGNAAPPVGILAGKAFGIRYDKGLVVDYKFETAESLQYRVGGAGKWKQARYQAYEPMAGVVTFGNLTTGLKDHDGYIVVLDLENGCATCFRGFLNTPYFANEAGVEVMFGKAVGRGLPDAGTKRHAFTHDLVGTAITWNYQPGLTSMHLYSTPHSMSWIIFQESGAGGMQWSGPSGHVKIRDGLYYIYWLEEACNGTLGTIVINMRTMHDAGIGYHCGEKGLSMSPVGAHARLAGKFDVGHLFAPRKETMGLGTL